MQTAMARKVVYSPKKVMIWGECERIMQSNVVVLAQANHVSTPQMADLRYQLRQRKLFLRFPKPGVLRAYLRESGHEALASAVIGKTFCAVSNAEPSQIAEALSLIDNRKDIVLLGGKVLNNLLTIEGLRECVNELPRLQDLQAQLVGLLQSPAHALVGMAQAAPLGLVHALKTHQDVNLAPNPE
jgi:ribosomal protein L10